MNDKIKCNIRYNLYGEYITAKRARSYIKNGRYIGDLKIEITFKDGIDFQLNGFPSKVIDLDVINELIIYRGSVF